MLPSKPQLWLCSWLLRLTCVVRWEGQPLSQEARRGHRDHRRGEGLRHLSSGRQPLSVLPGEDAHVLVSHSSSSSSSQAAADSHTRPPASKKKKMGHFHNVQTLTCWGMTVCVWLDSQWCTESSKSCGFTMGRLSMTCFPKTVSSSWANNGRITLKATDATGW